jgi:hypothetical protein
MVPFTASIHNAPARRMSAGACVSIGLSFGAEWALAAPSGPPPR